MLDKITLVKKNISASEQEKVIEKCKLVRHLKDGLPYWDNRRIKNFVGGFFVQIMSNGILKITGSVHKYFSFLKTGKLENHERFTMKQAANTLVRMGENLGFSLSDTRVQDYEVGANISVDFEPYLLFEKIQGIGIKTKEKILYINPKYKGESVMSSEMHKDIRRIHKMYDKVFEMREKRKPLPRSQIIRIETISRRNENLLLCDFMSSENLARLQNQFFREWDTLLFRNEIISKGKGFIKLETAKDIIHFGKEKAMREAENKYSIQKYTPKQFRTAKELINNWFSLLQEYQTKKPKIAEIWAIHYEIEKQILNTIDEIE